MGQTKGSVELGGSIESYPDATGALARAEYIQRTFKAAPVLGGEYDYVVGPNVLRLSRILTPSQAKAYAEVAGNAVGVSAQLVTVK
jgi:hypothetical protein